MIACNLNRMLRGCPLSYCHKHNLVRKDTANVERRHGIRVTLPSTDTFTRMLGGDWEKTHWFATETDRDIAFNKVATRHGYYRETDTPTQVLEKISR